jgi:hypothetical protein
MNLLDELARDQPRVLFRERLVRLLRLLAREQVKILLPQFLGTWHSLPHWLGQSWFAGRSQRDKKHVDRSGLIAAPALFTGCTRSSE